MVTGDSASVPCVLGSSYGFQCFDRALILSYKIMLCHSLSRMLVQCGPLKINKRLSGGHLNVGLFQAVAVCQIIELVTVLLTGVVNPHRDCVYYINPAHCWCRALPCPSLNFIRQVVHFLFELRGGLL